MLRVLPFLLVAATASAATPPRFAPSPELRLDDITRLLVDRSAALREDLLAVDLSRAEQAQARLWLNPDLDLSMNAFPLGETNPPGLNPVTAVPNYQVGLSYRFLLAKRGPRAERADALTMAASASLEAAARARAVELLRVLGYLAVDVLRRDAVRGLLDEGRNTVALARVRAQAGAGAALDIDRTENDLGRIEQQALAAEGDMAAALSACAGLTGMPCDSFADAGEARRFLEVWVERAAAHSGPIEERPDVRALDAQRRAAEAELRFADAQAIPDPTVRLGYTRDTFIASGAQPSSLSLSVSLPLPIADHGQAMARAARARRLRYGEERDRLIDSATARIAALREALEVQRRRRERLRTELIPRARAVLASLERGAENRLLPLTDVLQARRSLDELLLAEADSQNDAFQAALDLLTQLPAEGNR